jgi:archaemetzincin
MDIDCRPRRRGWWLAVICAAPLLTLLVPGQAPRQSLAMPSEVWPSPNDDYDDRGDRTAEALLRVVRRLRPLYPPLPPPQPGDWIAAHPEERGQRFIEYLAHPRNRPTAERHTLYVQPIGSFNEAERRIVTLTAEYLHRYFNLPVVLRPALPLSAVPQKAFRVHPTWKVRQLHTTTILDEVLLPRLPDDAIAYIAFTAVDLFPAPSWNFVFGQASLAGRVGVWSFARNGNPAEGEAGFRRCLARTLRIAAHEVGHMFGMAHCKAHPCDMNGVNSLDEADRSPLDPCPECLAKIVWLTGRDPTVFLRDLIAFAAEQGIESGRAQTALAALERKP